MEKSGHAVLLIHGLGGGPAEMLYLRRRLKEAGFHVEVPLLPGHCTHYKALNDLSWQQYAEVVYSEFEKLHAHYETVSVSGLCLGAVLALEVGMKYGDKVHALCPISTTLLYDGWGLPFFTKLLPLTPYFPFICRHLYIGEGDPYGVKDEKIRAWIKKKMGESSTTHYHKVSVKAISHMYVLSKLVIKNLRSLRVPICAIHPKEDDVTSMRSLELIRTHVQSKIYEELVLLDSYHLATLDRERSLVADTIIAFLKKTIEAR